jgi:hypothetical protein
MLNYKTYKVTGKNPKTGRKKTVTIDVPNNVEPHTYIMSEVDIDEPLTLTEVPITPPTERQIAYARDIGLSIPYGACKEDVSDLLDRYSERDSDPNPGLLEFASGRQLMFSNCIGKKALYNLVFYSLETVDQIAFFCFCVYRYVSDDRHANLDTSPYRDIFYAFANAHANDTKLIRSIEKYEGSQLRYFGKINTERGEYEGGSINTLAYKSAAEYLRTQFNTPLQKTKTFRKGIPIQPSYQNYNFQQYGQSPNFIPPNQYPAPPGKTKSSCMSILIILPAYIYLVNLLIN